MANLAAVLRANITARRKVLGLSQAELSRQSGVSETYLSQLLRDEPEGRNENPGIKQLARIAEALGTTVPSLLAGPVDEPGIKNSVRVVLQFLQDLDRADDESIRQAVELLRKR